RAFRHPLGLRCRYTAGGAGPADGRCPRHPPPEQAGGCRMKIAPQHRIYACFFSFALSTGALMARLPDIQTQLAVSEGQLGLTMIGMAIGSLISLTIAAPIIERLGFRTSASITTLGPAILLAMIPWMPSAPAVFAVLLIVGLLAGALEINLN